MARTKMVDKSTKRAPAPVVEVKVMDEVMDKARELMRPGQRIVIESPTRVLIVNR